MQTRPERRLFLGSPSQAVSEIHPLSDQRQDVPIHLSSILADIGPTHLHQNTQTSNRDSKKDVGPHNVYLHDMLIMNSTLEGARKDIMILKSILENLGFLINMEKSIFVAVQIIEFLGIIVDSTTMRYLLPDEKVAVIQKECRYLVSSQVASLSQLSHIIGKLTSCKTEVLQAPLQYRGIQHLKNSNTTPPPPPPAQGSQQLRHTFGSSCLRGPQVVGRQSSPCKWTPHSEFPSVSNDSTGCLQFGVGSSVQWGRHEGNMDKEGIQSSYQLQRATRSIIFSESIHQGTAKCPCID